MMNGFRKSATPNRKPFLSNHHFTALLLVVILVLTGCNDNPKLDARLNKPQLGNKFVSYQFALPDLKKIKARNPNEQFTLTTMNFTATSEVNGCAAEEKSVTYTKGMDTITVDLRPGCDYMVKIDGVGLQTSAVSPGPGAGPGTKPPPEVPPVDPNVGLQVTYQNDIAPLMQKHCISCHVEQGPMQAYPLSTAEQVRTRLANIIERVELENMPPRGPFFSDNQIKMLKDWKEQGFLLTRPLKISDQTPRLLCTSKEFTFRAGKEGQVSSGVAIAPDFSWYFETKFKSLTKIR